MKLNPEWVELWDDVPMLHVHAQASNHDEAHLVMNEAGRQQLLALLQQGGPVATAEFMPEDGEGFDLYVAVLPTERARQVAQQYTQVNVARDDAIWPWSIPEVRTAIVEKAEKLAAKAAGKPRED